MKNEITNIQLQIEKKKLEKQQLDFEIAELKLRRQRLLLEIKKKYTFEELGAKMGLTRQRVEQITNKK